MSENKVDINALAETLRQRLEQQQTVTRLMELAVTGKAFQPMSEAVMQQVLKDLPQQHQAGGLHVRVTLTLDPEVKAELMKLANTLCQLAQNVLEEQRREQVLRAAAAQPAPLGEVKEKQS